MTLSSGASRAALVTKNFTDVWDIYQYNPGGLGFHTLDPATVGASFSGTVTLDTTYPDSHGGPNHGQYITPLGYPGTFTLDFGRHGNATSHYAASLSTVYKNVEYPNGRNEDWGDLWYAATSYAWPQTIDGDPVAGAYPIVNTTLQLNLILGNHNDDDILPNPYSTCESSYVLLRLHGGNLILGSRL